jgi:hypothetical protein
VLPWNLPDVGLLAQRQAFCDDFLSRCAFLHSFPVGFPFLSWHFSISIGEIFFLFEELLNSLFCLSLTFSFES